MIFHTPQEVAETITHAYHTERDNAKVLSCVTEDIIWVGTEKNEQGQGKEQLKKFLDEDLKIFPDPFSFHFETESVQYLGDNGAVVIIIGELKPTASIAVGFPVRASICCEKIGGSWFVSHLHASTLNTSKEKKVLEDALAEEHIKQKALLDSIPGGIAMYRMKKDGRVLCEYVSDGLGKACGYSHGKEMLQALKVDARNMVLPEDLHILSAAETRFKQNGGFLSASFRVKGKDGTPVYLTLDGVEMTNAVLGEDDIAVVYAVQTIVSEDSRKKVEEEKALLTLINTVPAGIGIYEISEQGLVANYLNDAFYYIIGTTRAARTQYLGTNALEAVNPKDVPKIQENSDKILRGANFNQFDFRVKGEDGNWVWLHVNVAVVERKLNFAKVHVAFYECTESKKQQLRLVQYQKAVNLAEEQGKLSIWLYNIDKAIITQQELYNEVGHMGYPSYITNVPYCFVDSGCVHPEDVEKYVEAYNKLKEGAEEVEVVYRLLNVKTEKFDWLRMFFKRMEEDENGDRMAVGFAINVNKHMEAIERYDVEQNLREQMYADAIYYVEYNLTTGEYSGENNHPLDNFFLHKGIEEYREAISAAIDEPFLSEVVDKMYEKNLLKAFERGENKVVCEYRSKGTSKGPSRWHRVTATMVNRPDSGDVMAFVYVEDIELEKNKQLAIENNISRQTQNTALVRIADRHGWIIQSDNAYIPKGMEKEFVYDDAFVEQCHSVVVNESENNGKKAAQLSTILSELEKSNVYQYSITTKVPGEDAKRQLMNFTYLDDRKTHIIIMVNDITSLYLEEQQKKKRLQDALLDARKANRAKADFYSRMSHDMRTPMNGILGMTALCEGITDSKTLQANIKRIQESGEYLLNLINDTLDIQRIESGKIHLEPKVVNITDVVGSILDMVEPQAKEKGVKLQYSKGNTDLNWYVRADAVRLKQIFVNLLSNAIKFTPSGKTVTFEFKLLEREGMISHDVIYIKDNGIGMSKEFLKNGIFKPFSQESNEVSATYVGSGLGLAIVKNLVELMGGSIEVESELGRGTTFAVHLDFERVAEADAHNLMQSEKKDAQSIPVQLKGKKILLVEDHPLNATIAKKLLEKVGCEIFWVKDGQEAIDTFTTNAEYFFDAVLMDIRMPVMDGLTATREIRALKRADALSIPIIAMTANAYEEDRRASLAAGMNAHLGKPINPKVLYDTLARYL